MPFLVQHLLADDHKVANSTGVAFPSVDGSATVSLVTQHPKVPSHVVVERARLDIDVKSSSAALDDVYTDGPALNSVVGCVTLPIVVPTNSSAGSVSSEHNVPYSNYLFMFGGQHKGDQHASSDVTADTTLIDIETGHTIQQKRDSSQNGDSSAWPSARKFAAGCCVYRPRVAETIVVEPVTTDAKGGKDKKDVKVAVAGGKGGKAGKEAAPAEVIEELATTPPAPLRPPVPTVVLFGGVDGNGRMLDDLYTFAVNVEGDSGRGPAGGDKSHKSCWSKIEPAAGAAPGPRIHHTLTATASNRVILFGGYGYSTALAPAAPAPAVPAAPAATGKGAAAAAPAAVPPATTAAAVASTPAQLPPPQLLNDCWVLDCATWTWTKVITSGLPPAPRCRHAAAANSFLADSFLLRHNPFEIVLGADIRGILPVYEHLQHLIARATEPKQLLPSAAGAGLPASSIASSPAREAAASGAKSKASTVKGSGKVDASAAADTAALTAAAAAAASGLPSWLADPNAASSNPAGVDILFVFGGACSPPELAESFSVAKKIAANPTAAVRASATVVSESKDAGGDSGVGGATAAPSPPAASLAAAGASSSPRNPRNVRPDDMMDGTVHVLVIDPVLAEAVSLAYGDQNAAHPASDTGLESKEGDGKDSAPVQEPAPAPVPTPAPAPAPAPAKGGKPDPKAASKADPKAKAAVADRPPSAGKGKDTGAAAAAATAVSEEAAKPIPARPFAAWTTIPAMTYQMLGGSNFEVNSADSIEIPPGMGLDTGESTANMSLSMLMPANGGDNGDNQQVVGGCGNPQYGGSNTPHPSGYASRPPSRPLSRPSYKTMLRRKNDTYLRRINATASAYVVSRHPKPPQQGSVHEGGSIGSLLDGDDNEGASVADRRAQLPEGAGGHGVHFDSSASIVSQPNSGVPLGYYFLLHGGVTDVHVRNANTRLQKRAKGPVDEPVIAAMIPVAVTLELLSPDALKNRIASPVSAHHDGYGGIILQERHFDQVNRTWKYEVVRRPYPDGVYEGQCDAGVRTGTGKMEWNSDGPCRRYVGEWRDDAPSGKGTMHYADGSEYTGEWRSGQQEGTGSCVWQSDPHADTSAASAAACDPLFQSNGRVSIDGWAMSFYDGDWKGGMPHGQGTADFSIAGAHYAGQLENGVAHGHGELTLQLPDRRHLAINGTWRNGVLHGQAVWKKEHAVGGVLEVYSGPFVDGWREGEGAVADLEDGSHYAGPYRAGRRNGIGECRYANKDIYTGKFVGNQRNGKGTLLKCNGDIYAGGWKDDVMHGDGSYRNVVTGEEIQGLWVNGKLKERLR